MKTETLRWQQSLDPARANEHLKIAAQDLFEVLCERFREALPLLPPLRGPYGEETPIVDPSRGILFRDPSGRGEVFAFHPWGRGRYTVRTEGLPYTRAAQVVLLLWEALGADPFFYIDLEVESPILDHLKSEWAEARAIAARVGSRPNLLSALGLVGWELVDASTGNAGVALFPASSDHPLPRRGFDWAAQVLGFKGYRIGKRLRHHIPRPEVPEVVMPRIADPRWA